jgi:nitrite reductase/ring-hydroxylating ferredoxin subunit
LSDPDKPTRVRVAALCELDARSACVVTLPAASTGRPREALVVLDASGQPRAYRNLCRHLPVPLQSLARGEARRFTHDGELECRTHGARYRLHDGLCSAGPCPGSSLYALELEVRDGEVFVLDDAQV